MTRSRLRRARPSAIRSVLRLTRWGVIVALFALLVVPLASQAISGQQWIVVQGGSMSPTLALGDIIVVDPGGSTDVGDVVTARRPDSSLVTHRIVGVNDDGSLELRGDANTVTDPDPVARDAVVGTVVASIPAPASIAIRAATSLPGRLTTVGAVILLLLAPALLSKPDTTAGATQETESRSPGPGPAGTRSRRRSVAESATPLPTHGERPSTPPES